MKTKTIEISALLPASHSKSDITSQLKVSRRTVYWAADHLTNNETLKNQLHSGRSQVIS